MNQKVLDIFLPKERSLDQLKSFLFLKKMISEIESFFNNDENFLLLNIKLADLESRLNTVLPVEIMNPADEEKMNLINFELQQRGLEINDKEMKYIFTHHSRDLNSLLNLAEKLDEISHQEKKSISINLIKKII